MLNRLTLLFIFCCAFRSGFAQTAADLKFDQRFTRCEKKWVVLPPKAGQEKYTYGYIYVDMMAGFTFDLKGVFTVDANNHFIIDTTATKTAMVKYRLGPNTVKMALLPESHFKEMNIQGMPFTVKIYYSPYTDTVAHNFRMGYNLNAAGDCESALTYLQQVYKVNPHYAGLEFELAYAYNDLGQTDAAIAILTSAMKSDPKNPLFYRELGYAYMKKNDVKEATNYFKQGIDACGDKQNETKSEMAYNMAMVYKSSGQQDDYKEWMIKAKGWSAPTSNIYKSATSLGF